MLLKVDSWKNVHTVKLFGSTVRTKIDDVIFLEMPHTEGGQIQLIHLMPADSMVHAKK